VTVDFSLDDEPAVNSQDELAVAASGSHNLSAVRTLISAPALSVHHVVKGDLRIPHDLAKDTFAQIALAVDRDSGPAPVGMNEDRMASRLSIQHEAVTIENGNDLAGIEGRELWAHTATRTLWEPTSS
jgi:hypothetical protein